MTDKNNIDQRIAELRNTYPEYLSWRHSVTDEILYAGIYIDDAWIDIIERLLNDIAALCRDDPTDAPVFRDLKSKRGYLSIHYDGGSDGVDRLVEAAEESANQLPTYIGR
jgi:hypothetical protein